MAEAKFLADKLAVTGFTDRVTKLRKTIPVDTRLGVLPNSLRKGRDTRVSDHPEEEDNAELPEELLRAIEDQASAMQIDPSEELISRPSQFTCLRAVPSNPDEENIYEYTDPYQRLAVAMIKRAVDAIRNKEVDAYAALDWILGEGTQYNRITFEDLCDVLNCKAEYIRSEICRRV